MSLNEDLAFDLSIMPFSPGPKKIPNRKEGNGKEEREVLMS